MDPTSSRQAAPDDSPSAQSVRMAMEGLRKRLIDVSKRNRLLNAPVSKSTAKQLVIEDELSEELFKILYSKGRKMAFEPSRTAAEDEAVDDTELVRIPTLRRSAPSGPAAHRSTSSCRPGTPRGACNRSS